MAINKKEIIENYPLPVYSYRIIVNGNETMSFSEVSGLEIDHDHVLYRHGFSWITGDHLIRGQRKPIKVTLKRGLVKKRNDLYNWIKSGDKKDIRIELCDEAGLAAVSWDISRALPFKMDAPSFSASTNDIAIESLDLVAHDLRITHNE